MTSLVLCCCSLCAPVPSCSDAADNIKGGAQDLSDRAQGKQ